MSTITKEQAKNLRNAFQFWQQDYDPVEDKEQYDMFGLGMVAMDALLASLEPVSVFKIDHESSLIKHVKKVVSETNAPPAPEIYHVGDATMRHIFTPTGITDVSDMQPVFDQIETVLAGMWQPAPVSVPDEATPENIEILASTYAPCGVTYQWDRDECNAAADSWNACRAALLKGTYGNSPVVPDGWVMVPVEPTEDMIVNGFESEPDESFSDEKEWEAYDAMSGCQQAAHRAKLCWAAMISAAPKPDVR
ncbi:hypothetical protein [Enterobacter sp. Lyrl_3]|uniref:hypothetical protein n=1 Tax=Enterobacter sp. Lyrl_3 TaxID=3110922 RepID=UPI003F7E9419